MADNWFKDLIEETDERVFRSAPETDDDVRHMFRVSLRRLSRAFDRYAEAVLKR